MPAPTHIIVLYLKESGRKDLEGHGERDGGALPTLSESIEGRLAHHRPLPSVLLTSSMS